MTHASFISLCVQQFNKMLFSFACKLIIKVGEYVYQNDCGSQQCWEGGTFIYGDVFCDYGNCNNVTKPNACCPPCQVGITL